MCASWPLNLEGATPTWLQLSYSLLMEHDQVADGEGFSNGNSTSMLHYFGILAGVRQGVDGLSELGRREQQWLELLERDL